MVTDAVATLVNTGVPDAGVPVPLLKEYTSTAGNAEVLYAKFAKRSMQVVSDGTTIVFKTVTCFALVIVS